MPREKLKVVSMPIYGPDNPNKTINIFRCVNEPNLTCALCMENCGEQAGVEWYDVLGWKGCHMKCWKGLCKRYHVWLNGRDNTLQNFCIFMD